jgi:very-short-patch-repair endonuclease
MKAAPATREHAKSLRRSLTRAEVILEARLKGRQVEHAVFRRQHPIGPFIADFACVRARLVIEVDGATHAEDAEIVRDVRRTAFLESLGWHVLRVQNEEIYHETSAVIGKISDCLRHSQFQVPEHISGETA